jgi:hypothetical protein
MDDIRDKLRQLAATVSKKHLSRIVQLRHPDIMSALEHCHGVEVPEKMYNFLYNVSHICPNGSKYKFKSFVDGYKGCGLAGVCKCTNSSVSKSVSKTKQNATPAQRQATNAKRAITNYIRYGVVNIGQTPQAKAARAKVYSNPARVKLATLRNKATKLKRYGNANYTNIEKQRATCQAKQTPEYWANRFNNPSYLILYDRVQMEVLINNHTIPEIAAQLNVNSATVCRHLNNHKLRNPFKSSEEAEVIRFLQSIGVTNIVTNSCKLLGNRQEIDIYLPDFGVAIEYNGVFWHHTDIPHISASYHAAKFHKCEYKGIKLITLFSSVWKANKDAVKSELINYLGLNANIVDIDNSNIVSISTKKASEFHNLYNSLGHAKSSIHYGIVHSDEILAVMSIAKVKTGYSMVRCTINANIDNAPKRLLDHFITEHNPTKILAYTENEWLHGEMVSKLGFNLIEELKPICWYLSDRSEELYTEVTDELIEVEDEDTGTIVKRSKFLKVWSCGGRKWEFIV